MGVPTQIAEVQLANPANPKLVLSYKVQAVEARETGASEIIPLGDLRFFVTNIEEVLIIVVGVTGVEKHDPFDSGLREERNFKFDVKNSLLISTDHKVVAG